MADLYMANLDSQFVSTNGIRMHYVEDGDPDDLVVLLLHGYPETCYAWRYYIRLLSDASFRAIAPDLRGYGKTEVPLGVEKYTSAHIVGDLIGLLDALDIQKAFVVGHDWGATIAWHMCLFRPDRVIGLVSLGLHYVPRSRAGSPLQQLRSTVGEDYYVCRFQEPGKLEALIAKQPTENYFKRMFSFNSSRRLKGDKLALPSWMSKRDIKYYADEFERSGFTGPMNYYRALDLNWELLAPWTNAKVMTPTLFIVGDADIFYHFPGAKDYILNGDLKANVPNLKDIIILEGVHHFLHEEKPDTIAVLLLEFLSTF